MSVAFPYAIPSENADSKQEALLFAALDALSLPYIRHRPYSESPRGWISDAFVPRYDTWIEAYGGDLPVHNVETRKYEENVRAKMEWFLAHRDAGRCIVIYPCAIFERDFAFQLERALICPTFANVVELPVCPKDPKKQWTLMSPSGRIKMRGISHV